MTRRRTLSVPTSYTGSDPREQPKPACEPIERRLLLCNSFDEFWALPPLSTTGLEQREAALAESPHPAEAGGSTIVWVNRNNASNNFAATFGSDTALAMGVVDAVIAQYQRIIQDFRWIGGTTQFALRINMRNRTAPDFGGQARPDLVGLDPGGSPISGQVDLGRGIDTNFDGLGDGEGWYLDPTPDDFAEFPNVRNGFVGDAPDGSDEADLFDFYSLVAHEVGHTMGMTSASGSRWRTDLPGYATSTGLNDAGGAGVLWAYKTSRVGRALITDSDLDGSAPTASHTAVVGQNFNFNGENYVSARDVMNNTFEGVMGRRRLPSNLMLGMLADVYGYGFTWPEQFGSMYTSLNTTTGVLTVRGGADGSNDLISISTVSGGHQVSVDIGNDVPGTGPTDAFVSFWPTSDVSQIVVNAGDGDDTIQIRSLQANSPVIVNAQQGNDRIEVAIGDFDGNLQSDALILGGGGDDRIWVNDLLDGSGGDLYTITSDTLSKPQATIAYSAIEHLQVLGSDQANTWHVETFNGDLTLEGGDGNDVFNIAEPTGDLDSLNGRVTVLGAGGSNTLNLYDQNDLGADHYLFDAPGADNLSFIKTVHTGVFEGASFFSIDHLLLDANGDANRFDVDEIFAGNVTINGNNGADTLNLGAGDVQFDVISSSFRFNGGDGADVVVIDDAQHVDDDTHVLDRTTLTVGTYTKDDTLLVFSYDSILRVTLDTSDSTNDIEVKGAPQGTELLINGNFGGDTAIIGGGDIDVRILGEVLFDASIGGTVVFDDKGGALGASYILEGGALTTDANTIKFESVTHVEMYTTEHGDNISLRNTFGYSLELYAGDGNDLIRFGNGNLAFMEDATIFGGEGGDEIFFDDLLAPFANEFIINQTGGLPFVDFQGGNRRVTYDSIHEITIEASPRNDSITSFAVPPETTLRINGHDGDDFIAVQGHPTQSSGLFPRVIVDAGGGLDLVEVNTDGGGEARAVFNESQDLFRLAIGDGGRLRLAEGGRLIDVQTQTAMPPTGFELDLTDGFFVRRQNPGFAIFNSRLAAGYNGGAWDGMAINSSRAAATVLGDALGIARASELFGGTGGTIAGINLAADDIIIRYTLYGDSTLDGTVSIADFSVLGANFNASGANWVGGDYNYDNITNIADFALQAGNFNQSVADLPRRLPPTPGMFSPQWALKMEPTDRWLMELM